MESKEAVFSVHVVANKWLRYDKPWTIEKNPRRKWERIIFWGSILVGFALGGLICYFAYASVTNHEVKLCSECVQFSTDSEIVLPGFR